MFSREEAKARLESAEIANWERKQESRIARLPATLRGAAGVMFGGKSYLMSASFETGIEQWLDLTTTQRRKIFEAIAPGRADILERTWQECDRLPYSVGWVRRPFRVSDRPEIYLGRRGQAVRNAASVLAKYQGTIPWFAAWSSHFWADISTMLAAEIDAGPEGKETLATLVEILEGTHAFGAVSRSAIRALLTCDRPEAWESVEKLVVAAQRQEGIRQAVFESADEVHPEAFKRLLRLVVAERLTRFASVVRAFGVWLGLPADVTERKRIDRILALIADGVADRQVSDAATQSDDPEVVYTGLWSHAFNDASGATVVAERLLNSKDGDIRFAITHFLGWVHLPESRRVLRRLLRDDDRKIAARAFSGLAATPLLEYDSYDDLQLYVERLDRQRKITVPVWEWIELEESPSAVLQLMLQLLHKRHPVVLHGYLSRMDASTRSMYVRHLIEAPMTPESRRALVDLATDRSQWVAVTVFKALEETGITPEEAPVFERLLTRKTGTTRSAALGMLASQGDAGALDSAQRLLLSTKTEQRLGGLELLRKLKEAGRDNDAVASIVVDYQARRARIGEAEATMLEYLTSDEGEEATLDDGLGLFDPSALTVVVPPSRKRIEVSTKSHQKILKAADTLVEQNRDIPLTVSAGYGTEERLYGDQMWGLEPRPGDDPADSPLGDIWRQWWQSQRPAPFDLERCVISIEQRQWQHHKTIAKKGLPPHQALEYLRQVGGALWWLWFEHGSAAGIGFLLDGLENALAMVPRRHLRDPEIAPHGWGDRKLDWRASSPAIMWAGAINTAWALRPDLKTRELIDRRWRIESWLDRLSPQAPRHRAEFSLLLEALGTGAANKTDLLDHLIGPRSRSRMGYGASGFDALRMTTGRRTSDAATTDPEVVALVDTVRDRVIDVELRRGDIATASSAAALAVRSVAGANRLISVLHALGKGTLVRGWSWNAEQKNGVLSHLIRVSHPAENDTPALFVELIADSGVSDKRLLEVAVYAPQWSRYVEHAVGWDGLKDAVYWLHAHTKDDRWSVDRDVREAWAAEIASRTPLTPLDLVDGGVDVDWFRNVLDKLGEERWEELLAFVKYTSGGGGHKRAEMFGEALRGAVTVEALMERIRSKRHQDTVRALGLVPLTDDPAKRDAAVLERYQLFQEFKAGSRKYGSQKQASEKRAFEIGLDNLARTAGYPDPIRLQWEMETLEAGDLARGQIVLDKEPYLLELGIDSLGKAAVTVSKDEQPLKSVPAKLRKDKDVVALRARATTLRRQVARVRSALEAASVFGDAFSGSELERLHHHPVLRPMLASTLFVLPDGTVGLPIDDGVNLRPLAGRKRKIGNRPVRPAHPVDLLASGQWSEWQHSLFVDEVTQPFKQVFRELYVLTKTETEDGKKSTRYAGHQVNPRQAAALFGSRGWTSHPDGYTFKTFHREDLVAVVHFDAALFTPAEVDGATMYGLTFQRRGEFELLDLEAVPPRLFSEVLRDLDLVVSVAHMGGVDPEASASTVEMRTALVRETAMLLALDNVRFTGSHVMVDGTIGNYSIHLGSGQVHRQPGGALCIIPVGSQHRGRLFLPFADDDPRTAEVVSKTVLLARDDQIKDPTILEQIL